MAIDNLQQAVLDKARAEAEELNAQAKREADAHFERESARLREEHERKVAAIKAEVEADLERQVGNRRTEDRNKILATKNEMIEEIFAKAIKAVRELSDNGYATWLKTQLAQAPKIDGAAIAVNKDDRSLMESILAADSGSAFKLAETPVSIKGGMVVQSPQVDLDFSVESLLGIVRESLAGDIAAQLFAEPEEDKN